MHRGTKVGQTSPNFHRAGRRPIVVRRKHLAATRCAILGARMKTRLLLVIAVMIGGTVRAQTPPPAAQVNHDFDFWIGDWNVNAPDGKPAGTNRIESVAGGRGLYENWEGATRPNGQPGGSGKSLNAFNPVKNQWQQFWIGSGGNVAELAGGLVDGKMVLSSAERKLSDGRTMMSRITWTPNADGSVRQLWEQTFDGGRTWTTAFDGHYVKKK